MHSLRLVALPVNHAHRQHLNLAVLVEALCTLMVSFAKELALNLLHFAAEPQFLRVCPFFACGDWLAVFALSNAY